MRRRDALILLGFAVARVLLSWGSPIRFPDSSSYERLEAVGLRLWTVPTVYTAIPSDRLRVGFQVGAAVGCWAFAAAMTAGSMKNQWFGTAGLVLVCAFGLTSQVMQWDSIILSESLSISLLVLLYGCALWLVRNRSAGATLGLLVVAALWAYTRHVNVLVLLPVALVAFAVGLSTRRRVVVMAAAGLVVIAGVGAIAFTATSDINHYNANGLLGDRILVDDTRTRFFVSHGMPQPTAAMMATAGRFSGNEEPFLSNSQLQEWIEREWNGTYVRYLLEYPVGAVVQPAVDLPDLWDPEVGFYNPTETIVGSAAAVLFVAGDRVFAAVLAALAVLAVVRFRRREHQLLDVVAVGFMVGAACMGALVWHLAATELDRLMLPPALAFRLGLLLYVLSALDRHVENRATVKTGADELRAAPR